MVAEVAERTIEMAERVTALLAPPPLQSVSEWADENVIVPPPSPEPGKWRTDRVPYTRRPLDLQNDPSIHEIVLIWGIQLAKSMVEMVGIGYFVDQDPQPMLMVQPSQDKARAFSKERLEPLIRATPCLAKKIPPPKSRDANNSITSKMFPGGDVALVGSNAPADLASRPRARVYFDETDRFDASAGKEGDQYELAKGRMSNWWNWQAFAASSPGIKGESRIESLYLASSQEVWCVPCPSCGCYQPFEWDRLIFDSVRMVCAFCGAMHTEHEWKIGQTDGIWIAREEHERKGFHLSAMASPWLKWPALIKQFQEAREKGPEQMKVFVNTRLAETWEERGEQLEETGFENRRHFYGCDVPKEVLVLTSGVDVHPDRLELEITGWGREYESWGIQYMMLPGDPKLKHVWQDLDAVLDRSWKTEDGRSLRISCACVDSGHAADEVYAFCRERLNRRIFAIKGDGGPGKPALDAPKRLKTKNVILWHIGTDASKDLLFSRIMNVKEVGPGFCHWPMELELSNGDPRGYDADYFDGMMSEHRVIRKHRGVPYHAWIKKAHARNESWDCRIYSSAAIRMLQIDWDALEAAAKGERSTQNAQRPASSAAKRRVSRRQGV